MGISFWDVGVHNVDDILYITVNNDPRLELSGEYKVTEIDEFSYVMRMLKILRY